MYHPRKHITCYVLDAIVSEKVRKDGGRKGGGGEENVRTCRAEFTWDAVNSS